MEPTGPKFKYGDLVFVRGQERTPRVIIAIVVGEDGAAVYNCHVYGGGSGSQWFTDEHLERATLVPRDSEPAPTTAN